MTPQSLEREIREPCNRILRRLDALAEILEAGPPSFGPDTPGEAVHPVHARESGTNPGSRIRYGDGGRTGSPKAGSPRETGNVPGVPGQEAPPDVEDGP